MQQISHSCTMPIGIVQNKRRAKTCSSAAALRLDANLASWEVSLSHSFNSSQQIQRSPNPPCSSFTRNHHRVALTHVCCSPKEDRDLLARQEHQDVGNYTTVTGIWLKDRKRSSSMDEACDVVALPFIYRKAIRFLNKLVLVDNERGFTTVLKAGGILDVEEEYPWTGEDVVHRRRDKRRGTHTGRVCRTDNGFPCIMVRWNDPYGGTCVDTFELVDGSHGRELKQSTNMIVGDRCVDYVTYYHRS